MKTYSCKTIIALAATAALGFSGLVLPLSALAAAPPPPPSVSKAATKPLQAMQAASQAKNWAEVIAKSKDVEALPNKTPYDVYVMHQFLGIAYVQMQRYEEAIPSFQLQLDSGFLSPEDTSRIQRALVSLNYQAKKWPEAVTAGRVVIASGKANAETYFMIAHSQYFQNLHKDVVGTVKQYLDEAATRNEKPEENCLIINSQSQIQLGESKGIVSAYELLVQYYPKPGYWRDLMVMERDVLSRGTSSDVVTLNLYRLMREVDALKDGNDYLEMAQLAVQLGSPGEAVDAINRGTAANIFSSDNEKSAAKTQLQTAQRLSDTDRAGLAKFETEAKAAKAGEADVRLGQAYLSYNDAEQAVTAIQRGIAKGSLRNADEAQILLGISLLRLGRKDEAVAAFKATKGTDARLGELARLWSLRARA
jgi:tetratricopeptide (TPR) repeat protein